MKPGENSSSTKNNDMFMDNGGSVWRKRSYGTSSGVPVQGNVRGGGGGGREEFHFQQQRAVKDSPSKPIRELHHRRHATGDFLSLDMDFDMQEPKQDSNVENITLSRILEWPLMSGSSRSDETQAEVSFERQVRGTNDDNGRVLRCTSSAMLPSNTSSFKRKSTIQTNKNMSRLLDPPEQKPGRPSPVQRSEEEEDDPFLEEDFPQEYKKAKIDLLTLLESVSLVLIMATLVYSLTVPHVKHKRLWTLEVWKWEVLILVLICGRLVSSWGIRIIVFFIERNFLLRKKVLYFVYGLRKGVQNCLWLGLVLITWHFLFDEKVQRATGSNKLHYVSKVLICLLLGTFIWLVKTLIVKVLASSFHVKNYFDRIQESLFNQYVIETLSGPPLIEIKKAEVEEEKLVIEVENLLKAGATMPPILDEVAPRPGASGRVIGSGRRQKSPNAGKGQGNDEITIDHLHRLSPRNISAWNMKRLMNLICYGNLTTLDEQITGHNNVSTKEISTEIEAKAAAKKIFYNVARRGSKYIYIEDLMRFMPEDEASMTINLFEGASESHRIKKSSLKNWVVNAFRERRALALSLDDTRTAVKKLHRMVNIIVRIIILIVWLLILGITTRKFLVLITSQILLVVFMFGNSCRLVFEAIIFLFVMHPFDVGDRCEIDGVQMVVEEMNILTTVFLRADNLKIIFPNSQLALKCIYNHRRSPDMGDTVEFYVHIATPAETIAAMKQRITSYIESKSEHWCPEPTIVSLDLGDLDKLKIAVWLTHRMNHQDMDEKFTRRALLIEEMIKIFKELDIQYRLLGVDLQALPFPISHSHPPFWTATSSSSDVRNR